MDKLAIRIEKLIKEHQENRDFEIEVKGTDCKLVPFSKSDIGNAESINLLSRWRRYSEHAFLKVFEVTESGTETWLKKGVLDNPYRLMFWVVSHDGEKIGHIGVSSFNFEENSCEVDNVIKSPDYKQRGLFYFVTNALVNWIENEIQPRNIKLRVFSDNVPAISLYRRCGFKPIDIITFKKITMPDYVEWVESDDSVDRCFIVMELN
ncbi:GNAT family N-acetyltransferase [Enterovibrio baiacu]|uniref:GNAT family N-acetyltransferase n=1 Tax=Enterovibrio baiacu TaxID=2491023 RepID=UPI0010101F5B|nr:GNAT family N-acetyltransferase [Enterovibrio baiacu]MBE1274799.1 GNAT family N-acetyltransferase [Enterovibrio baiacu]